MRFSASLSFNPSIKHRVLSTLRSTVLLGSLIGMCAPSSAQDTTPFKEQYKLIKAPDAVASIGNDLFGDNVNLYSGSLEFIQTDVNLPGNSALNVAVGRRLVTGRHLFDDRAFGRWDLEIPRMHGVFAKDGISTIGGWKSANGSGDRCTSFGAPPETRGVNGSSIWTAPEFWQGNSMYVPGYGDQVMLRRASDFKSAPAAFAIDGVTVSSFPIVTANKWAIGCLPSLANDSSAGKTLGQGFVAVAPDGTRYKFDWMVTYKARSLTKSFNAPGAFAALAQEENGTLAAKDKTAIDTDGGIIQPTAIKTATLSMDEVWILPTKVIDRFGNTVTYTYDPSRPANLKRIDSSDGRSLTFTYWVDSTGDTNRVRTVSDGTRTWTYSYNTSGFLDLSQVQLPDGARWQIDSIQPLIADVQYVNDGSDYCNVHALPYTTTLIGAMTHPSGAVGTFTLQPTEHGRSDVQQACLDRSLVVPIYYFTNSLISKNIAGPGLSGMTWDYEYGPPNGSFSPCNGCVTNKTVSVTDPAGDVTRYTFGNRYFVNEGKLEQTDEGWNGSTALRTTQTEYRAIGAGPYPVQDGISDENQGTSASDQKNRPVEARTVTQQGETFAWRATSFDEMVRPLNVLRASSLGHSRTESTTYFDHGKWVLGQVSQVMETGSRKVMVSNAYYSDTALLSSVTEFGKLKRSMTYSADGTLLTSKDGKNQTTTFQNYKAGIPQKITYANSTGESALVNGIGKITSITNEAGATTTFGYDAMGRLASVQHPVGDTVSWAPTAITFWQATASHGDLAAGHWRQQVKVGNATTLTFYDALWRPVYTERYDSADVNGTARVMRKLHDFAGRTTFESYPARSYAPLGEGVETSYDVLGRPVSTRAWSELGYLSTNYSYEAGFATVFTDARQNRTTYRYEDFDQPTANNIARLSMPEGVDVAITRDVFGKTTAITRSGGGKSLARRYVYDEKEQLCKTIEPEIGATVQDYDAADNLSWKATGLALPSLSCDKDTALASTARKTTFAYDTRNRLTSTSFGDASAAISRTYTPDSLPETISSNGTIWTYTYNKRRLNERESLSYGGRAYNIDRAYDANGSLAQLTYPVDNLKVAYSPNALGEPRQVGTYASQITYHPNGAVAGFVYGNGIRRTLGQNVRGLPQRSTDEGVLDESYVYDQNANVKSITDLLQSTATRSMNYDGLDRLASVSAPALWGSVTYGYDALDNLTTTAMTGGPNARSTLHVINPSTNRLESISNGPAAFSFSYGYDLQGNITKRGTQTYRFDLANRMTQADGRATYVYDGHGRRTSVVGTDGVNRVQVYSQDGQLLYIAPTGGTGTKNIYLNNHQIAEVK